SLAAPSGAFTSSDNGTYLIQVVANQVADTSGNFASVNSIAVFHININDTTAPTALLTPITPISDTGGQQLTFTVTYSDDVAVSTSSLGSTDLLVTGPRSFSQLATLL